jgi:hypothetical protein
MNNKLVNEITEYVLDNGKELEDLLQNFDFSEEEEKIIRDEDGLAHISPECMDVFKKHVCLNHIYVKCRMVDSWNA